MEKNNTMKESMTANKKINILFFSTIAFALAFIITTILGFTGVFFGGGNQNASNDIMLGQTSKVQLVEGASALTLSFNGTAIPGDTYQQNINLQLPYEQSSSFVRASFYLVNSNGNKNYIKVELMEDWIAHTDNYYYYNHVLKNGENISLTRSIKIPTEIMLKSDTVYNIVVLIETLKQDVDITKIWTTAPADLIANTTKALTNF